MVNRHAFTILTCALFTGLFLVVLLQLLGRVFGMSILFAEDASSILFIWFVMAGSVVAYLKREHLEVDLLHNAVKQKLPRLWLRVWSTFIYLSQLAFFGIFAAGLVMMMRKTWNAGYGSLSDFRFGYLYLGVLVCVGVTMLILLVRMLRGEAPGNKETH